MTTAEEEGTPSRLGVWLIGLLAILGVFLGVVLWLNATVYSASGFVQSYLWTLQTKNPDAALAFPGVVRDAGASDVLLARSTMTDIDDVEIVGDEQFGDGVHEVTVSYTIAGRTAQTSFVVDRVGTRFGLFSTWRFEVSPLSLLSITPLHDDRFTANGLDLVSAGGPGQGTTYQVFVPSFVELTHTSSYLTAAPVFATVTDPHAIVSAEVDIQASTRFVELLQGEVDAYLDECVVQRVLFPSGCPFGYSVKNRVETLPVWSIGDYPKIVVEPANEPGAWRIPPVGGTAHVTIGVQSLFDGSLSTVEDDVSFTLDWIIRFGENGVVQIEPQG